VVVTMPETEGVDAVLLCWLKQPGEEVEADEPICLVRVAELEAEVVSPASGFVASALAEAGQGVLAGASLAEVATTHQPEPVPPIPEPEDPDPGKPLASPQPPEPVRLRSFHSPAVRRLASEHGLDLAGMPGTGRDGRISRNDVLAHLTR
jgi:pyruvate/2-oxoglutarate dehydrogenase complex dihydrolipoamide acyltransferase (E2) component